MTFRESAVLIADITEAARTTLTIGGFVHRDPHQARQHHDRIRGPGAKRSQNGTVGRPLVVDFGLALRDEAEVVMTVDGQLVGTPRLHRARSKRPGGAIGRTGAATSTASALSFMNCSAANVPSAGHGPCSSIRSCTSRRGRHGDSMTAFHGPWKRSASRRWPRSRPGAIRRPPSWRPTLRAICAVRPVQARPRPARCERCGSGVAWQSGALAATIALAIAALTCLLVLSVAFGLREGQSADRERENAIQLASASPRNQAPSARRAEYRQAESHLGLGLALCRTEQCGPRKLLWLARMQCAPPDAEDASPTFV